jgi:F-type H+-transporting ATPase subunit c
MPDVGLIHYLCIALVIGLPTLGVAIGQGIAARKALQCISRQPASQIPLSRTLFISIALSETGAIIAVLVAFLLLSSTPVSHWQELGELGIVLGLTLPAFAVGIASGLITAKALIATARQPERADGIGALLLLLFITLQTPVIFGLIISILIYNGVATAVDLASSMRFVATGLTLGIGCVGPIIGLARNAQALCSGMGITTGDGHTKLRSFAYVSAGLIETPILFALITALLLLFAPTKGATTALGFIAVGCCVGLTTLGAGIASGSTAAAAATQMALKPQLSSLIARTSMLCQTLIDTVPIYGLLVALIILFTS